MSDQNQPAAGVPRAHWGSRAGFILAAAGSAVGLGNIWKFPYITGVYGGGAFVLVYLGSVLIVGLPLMIAELMIGRNAQENPVGAFQKLSHERSTWQGVGWLGVASGFVILSFYSVVAGWAMAYIFKAINGFSGTAAEIQGEFSALVSDPTMSILWHTIFMALTMAIVLGGIRQGIERWSKILMPALLVILFGLMCYGLFFTEGGSRAVSFLFAPDFSKLTGEGILSALGHAFFTLSLGMGAMITYGSYMGSRARIVRDAVTISIFDTVVALLAGLAIFSLVFSYNLEPNAGPGLIYQTLPVLFADIGRGVSIPFFVLLVFAALSSSISLLEVVVSYFVDCRGWKRKNATLIMGGLMYVFGLLSALSSLKLVYGEWSTNFFALGDDFSTNYMLPIGGLLTCLFAGWVVSSKIRKTEFGSSGFMYKGFVFTLRFITPLAVFIVLLHGVGLISFTNSPPVLQGGSLNLSHNTIVVGQQAESPTLSAVIQDADSPAPEDFTVTVKLSCNETDSVLVLAEQAGVSSEQVTILPNDDGTYTVSFSLDPSTISGPGLYDVYFEVSDGKDQTVVSMPDAPIQLEVLEDSLPMTDGADSM